MLPADEVPMAAPLQRAGEPLPPESAEMRSTLRALRAAAVVRGDAKGRCWPGGVPIAGSPGSRPGTNADDAIYGLLGCPDELDA